MTRAHVVGFDPDCGGQLGGSGIAVVTTRKVLAVGIAPMTKKLTGMFAVRAQVRALAPLLDRVMEVFNGVPIDRALVEFPMDYGQKRHADPNDLMRLSAISGAALALMAEKGFATRIGEVFPYQWKGQRSKSADWRNTLTYYDIPFKMLSKHKDAMPKFVWPEDVVQLSEIRQNNLPEILDAMGIAIHALQKEGAWD